MVASTKTGVRRLHEMFWTGFAFAAGGAAFAWISMAIRESKPPKSDPPANPAEAPQ